MDDDYNLYDRRTILATTATFALPAIAGCADSDGDGEEGGNAAGNGDTKPSGDGTKGGQSGDGNGDEQDTEENSGGSADVILGEAVEGDGVSMVAQSVEYTDKLGEYQEADSGNEFAVIRMVVKNSSDAYVNFSNFWQTRLVDKDDYTYDAAFASVDHPLESGYLAPGEVVRGDTVYEVPKDAEGLSLQFDFSAFDFFNLDRVTIDLSQQADETADFEQELGVDILGVGDKDEHKGVSITVDNVRYEDSLGSFAEAEEGNEYVIPEILVGNDTGEPLTVSTVLQMRVKDQSGLSYRMDISGQSQLERGYSESSDIADGEQRRGELAFEVPKDADVLHFVFDFMDLGSGMKTFWEL